MGASQNLPVLGILGGGQLARMLAQAANQLGCRTTVLDTDPHAPAFAACAHPVVGDWRDPAVLLEFARAADVVTLENEFIDAAQLRRLVDAGVTVRPGPDTLEVIQDKFTQRTAFQRAGLPVPVFAAVQTVDDAARFAAQVGWPLVLKARRNGYDGRGNARAASAAELPAAWARLGGGERAVYAEAFCPFVRELAVMVCRTVGGEMTAYPVVETVQQHDVCRVVRAPAPVSPLVADAARTLASRAVETVGGVGCFGVELFELGDGTLVLNEVAPRVHNSGHYTIEACVCSQFENHVRAVLGWPLGSTAMRLPAATMVNLFGAAPGSGAPTGLDRALRVPGAHVHVYGKRQSAAGRKMGHVTAIGDDLTATVAAATEAAEAIRFGGIS